MHWQQPQLVSKWNPFRQAREAAPQELEAFYRLNVHQMVPCTSGAVPLSYKRSGAAAGGGGGGGNDGSVVSGPSAMPLKQRFDLAMYNVGLHDGRHSPGASQGHSSGDSALEETLQAASKIDRTLLLKCPAVLTPTLARLQKHVEVGIGHAVLHFRRIILQLFHNLLMQSQPYNCGSDMIIIWYHLSVVLPASSLHPMPSINTK